MILLIGETKGHLGQSIYLREIEGKEARLSRRAAAADEDLHRSVLVDVDEPHGRLRTQSVRRERDREFEAAIAAAANDLEVLRDRSVAVQVEAMQHDDVVVAIPVHVANGELIVVACDLAADRKPQGALEVEARVLRARNRDER